MHTDGLPLMFPVLSYRSSTVPTHDHRSPSPECRFSHPSSRTPKNGGYSRQRFYPDSPIRWTRSSRLLCVASRLFNPLRDLQSSPDVAVCPSFDQHLPMSRKIPFHLQLSLSPVKPPTCISNPEIVPTPDTSTPHASIYHQPFAPNSSPSSVGRAPTFTTFPSSYRRTSFSGSAPRTARDE